jgi:hypothetical protein
VSRKAILEVCKRLHLNPKYVTKSALRGDNTLALCVSLASELQAIRDAAERHLNCCLNTGFYDATGIKNTAKDLRVELRRTPISF